MFQSGGEGDAVPDVKPVKEEAPAAPAPAAPAAESEGQTSV